MRRTKTKTIWAFAALFGILTAFPRIVAAGPVTGYNEDAKLSIAGAANDFDIVIRGNRTFGNFRFGFPGPGNGVTSTYNSVTDQTTLAFFGAAVPLGTTLHFGYTLADGTPNYILASWGLME